MEPHPHSFAKLCDTYNGIPGQWLDNSAVSDIDGEIDLYCSDLTGVPIWREQTFSLIKSQHARAARISGEQIFSVRVPAKTLNTLFHDHNVEALDVFHVDAEGSDFKIILQLLNTRIRPSVIIYENAFLEESDQTFLSTALEAENYCLTHTPLDTIACNFPEQSTS